MSIKLTEVLLNATVRKGNIDSHYNHKLNQYGNIFILELNSMACKHLDEESEKLHENNDTIFSMDITKRSIDDRIDIPIR